MYRIALALAALIAVASTPRAQLIALNDDPFTSSAPSVDIGSVPSGTRHPVYTVAGGALGNVTVSFDGYFAGQTLSSSYPINVFGSPVGPLTFEIPSSPFADGNAVRSEGLFQPTSVAILTISDRSPCYSPSRFQRWRFGHMAFLRTRPRRSQRFRSMERSLEKRATMRPSTPIPM